MFKNRQGVRLNFVRKTLGNSLVGIQMNFKSWSATPPISNKWKTKEKTPKKQTNKEDKKKLNIQLAICIGMGMSVRLLN